MGFNRHHGNNTETKYELISNKTVISFAYFYNDTKFVKRPKSRVFDLDKVLHSGPIIFRYITDYRHKP